MATSAFFFFNRMFLLGQHQICKCKLLNHLVGLQVHLPQRKILTVGVSLTQKISKGEGGGGGKGTTPDQCLEESLMF